MRRPHDRSQSATPRRTRKKPPTEPAAGFQASDDPGSELEQGGETPGFPREEQPGARRLVG